MIRWVWVWGPWLAVGSLAGGCLEGDYPEVATWDRDEDGVPDDQDCEPTDEDVYPGNVEECANGVDDNCNGDVDDWDEDCGIASASDDYVLVTAGYDTTCGLHADGTADCWGARMVLGGFDYSTACAAPDVTFAVSEPSTRYTTLAAGMWNVCGVLADGSLLCWGEEDTVQPPTGGGPYVHVARSHELVCALDEKHWVECWHMEDGHGVEFPPVAGPYAALSTGLSEGACGVLETTGELHCWPADVTFSQPPDDGPYVDVAVGFHNACAVTEDGRVQCWGAGCEDPASTFGQCGAPSGLPFTQVQGSYHHGCGVTAEDEVRCWGCEDSDYVTFPFDWGECNDPHGPAVQVAVGKDHTCALGVNGRLQCWGFNAHEQVWPEGGLP